MAQQKFNQDHSSAWIIQTWASFILAISLTSIGIIRLPAGFETKAFMVMGLAFTVASTASLTKTLRDIHESNKLISKIEEAKVEKMLSEHNNNRY